MQIKKKKKKIKNGETPFTNAFKNGNKDLVEYLVKHGEKYK